MISAALRIDIENWASRRNDRALFRMARDGSLTPAMVTRYIANVTWGVKMSAEHMRVARERSKELGDSRLAAYFEQKISEESGHEEWGYADLESLTQLVAAPPPTVTKAIRTLNEYLAESVEQTPAVFLVWAAFAEYLTVLIGPELLRNIQENCGVPQSSMTVVGNHIELDRDHAEENFDVIDDLVVDPRMLDLMRTALRTISTLFDAFCEEVTEVVVERHASVSAA